MQVYTYISRAALNAGKKKSQGNGKKKKPTSFISPYVTVKQEKNTSAKCVTSVILSSLFLLPSEVWCANLCWIYITFFFSRAQSFVPRFAGNKIPLWTKQSPEETQAQALTTTRGTEAAVLVAASIRLSPLLTLRLSVNTSSPQHQRHERTRCSDQPPRGAATDKTQVENWIHSFC